MKVILTGSTGTVGTGVLHRCLSHPQITSIVALTRRPLETKHEKLKNIIHTDFLQYDDKTIEQLKGAEACVWALGSPTSGKEVHVDYTTTFVKICQDQLVPQLPAGRKFRFVYTSGGLITYLDSKFLFFLGAIRKIRGDLDRSLITIAEQDSEHWESYIARPWYVAQEPPMISSVVPNSYILITELGAAMVDAALNGCQKVIMDNAYMREQGQAALKVQPN